MVKVVSHRDHAGRWQVVAPASGASLGVEVHEQLLVDVLLIEDLVLGLHHFLELAPSGLTLSFELD